MLSDDWDLSTIEIDDIKELIVDKCYKEVINNRDIQIKIWEYEIDEIKLESYFKNRLEKLLFPKNIINLTQESLNQSIIQILKQCSETLGKDE